MHSESIADDKRTTGVPAEIVLSLVDNLDAMLAYWDGRLDLDLKSQHRCAAWVLHSTRVMAQRPRH